MKRIFAFAILFAFCSVLFAQGQADNSSSLTRQGINKVRGGYYDEAIKLFDRAIDMDKQNVLAYYQRGRAKAGLGKYEEAIKDFNKTIELEPTYAPAYMDRGDAKRKLGDEAGGKKDIDKAVELDSSYKESGEIKVAEKPAEQDKTNKPAEPKKEKTGKPSKNKDELDRWQSKMDEYMRDILSKEELSAERYFQRGNGKFTIGNYEGAIEDYNKAVELNPNDAEAYNTRGSVKSLSGDYKGAIADFNKVIKLNPNNAWAYNNRGTAKCLSGDLEGGIEDWEKVIQLDSSLKDKLQPSIDEARKKINK